MLLQLVQALGAHCSQLRSLHIRELDLTDFELTFDLPLGHPFSLVGGNRLRYSARSGCEWLAALSRLQQLQVGLASCACAARLAGMDARKRMSSPLLINGCQIKAASSPAAPRVHLPHGRTSGCLAWAWPPALPSGP
jgi:hypothetical protein